MEESLENLIRRIIKDVQLDKFDKRVDKFTDYKNKYAILKSNIAVCVELKEGKVIKFDVSDYFKDILGE